MYKRVISAFKPQVKSSFPESINAEHLSARGDSSVANAKPKIPPDASG